MQKLQNREQFTQRVKEIFCAIKKKEGKKNARISWNLHWLKSQTDIVAKPSAEDRLKEWRYNTPTEIKELDTFKKQNWGGPKVILRWKTKQRKKQFNYLFTKHQATNQSLWQREEEKLCRTWTVDSETCIIVLQKYPGNIARKKQRRRGRKK